MKVFSMGGPIAVWIVLTVVNQNLSAQTLDFLMRQGHPHPWQTTAYPGDQVITTNAPPGWAPKLTGELTTACDGPCFTVKPTIGGREGEATVSFAGHGAELLTPALHTGVVEIGAQHWTIRVNVVRRLPYLPFFYRSGYPKGCRNTEKELPHADTCVISNEQPAASLGGLQAPGDTLVDPQFGSPVTRLTGPGYQMQYASVRSFSAGSVYVLTSDTEGWLQVWDRAQSRKVGERFASSNVAQTVWDGKIEDRIWFMKDSQVGYRSALSGKTIVAANFGKATGNRPALSALDTGGTADNTDDNWWVFTESKQKMVCAIDLNGLNPADQEQHLYCYSYAGLGLKAVDFAQVTQVDRESKKRYVLLLAEPHAHVFSVDTSQGSLHYEYQMPSNITTPHSDVGQDAQGRQVLFWTYYDGYGDKPFVATSLLNAGEKLSVPLEAGGGLSLLYPLYTGKLRTDAHFGCNWSGYCVVSTYADPVPGGIPNWSITDVTPGLPCVVKLGVKHPFRDGDRVAIGGMNEMPGVNGISKIKVVDPMTFALEGKTCTGKYNGTTGHVAESRQWSPTAPNRDEVVVVRLGGEARRVAMHRTKLWAEQGDLSLYWASPRAMISRDGKYVGFTSNLGLPEPNSVFWAEVDLADEISKVEVQSHERDALVRWDGPEEVTTLVSSDADMEHVAFSREHRAGQAKEQTIEGLKPDTVYYYHLTGKNSAFAGRFRTQK